MNTPVFLVVKPCRYSLTETSKESCDFFLNDSSYPFKRYVVTFQKSWILAAVIVKFEHFYHLYGTYFFVNTN